MIMLHMLHMSRGVTDVSNVKYKFKILFLIQILVNINMVIVKIGLSGD